MFRITILGIGAVARPLTDYTMEEEQTLTGLLLKREPQVWIFSHLNSLFLGVVSNGNLFLIEYEGGLISTSVNSLLFPWLRTCRDSGFLRHHFITMWLHEGQRSCANVETNALQVGSSEDQTQAPFTVASIVV